MPASLTILPIVNALMEAWRGFVTRFLQYVMVVRKRSYAIRTPILLKERIARWWVTPGNLGIRAARIQ